jgi:hypothetical protein
VLSGVWHHVLFTKSGTRTFLYVDGVQFGEGEGERIVSGDADDLLMFPPIYSIPLRIGHSSSDQIGSLTRAIFGEEEGQLASSSTIDDVAIWRRFLTQEEAAFLWLGGVGSPADTLAPPRVGIDTSLIDSYRQGVELSEPKYFAKGLYKIYSGDRTGHNLQIGDFGLSRPVVNRCERAFVDKEVFVSSKLLGGPEERLRIEEFSAITDGTIQIFSREGIKSDAMILSNQVGASLIMISEYPTTAFTDSNYVVNVVAGYKPFDDDVESVTIGGYVPYEWKSQSTGYDYDGNTPGTDSIAFGGMTY